MFILELCDDSIAGPCSSQSKEKVVAVGVGHRSSCWRKNLEKWFLVKNSEEKRFTDLSVLSSDFCNPAIGQNNPHAQDVFSSITIPGKTRPILRQERKSNSLVVSAQPVDTSAKQVTSDANTDIIGFLSQSLFKSVEVHLRHWPCG